MNDFTKQNIYAGYLYKQASGKAVGGIAKGTGEVIRGLLDVARSAIGAGAKTWPIAAGVPLLSGPR